MSFVRTYGCVTLLLSNFPFSAHVDSASDAFPLGTGFTLGCHGTSERRESVVRGSPNRRRGEPGKPFGGKVGRG